MKLLRHSYSTNGVRPSAPYGRVMDMETLRCAWRCVRKVKKASGVDGVVCQQLKKGRKP